MSFAASITPILGDDTDSDNTAALEQLTVNSFDPNDKTCLEGNVVGPELIGAYVHYLIRFENTGTANATNIVVTDAIDLAKFDLATLVPLHGSHDFVTEISGNNVEFIFEGIQLPFEDGQNDGFVAFKIKLRNNLSAGDTFANQAKIYFDYNVPIITNNESTSIQSLSVNDVQLDDIQLYPNPATLEISMDMSDAEKIQIFDMNGRLINTILNNGNKTVPVGHLHTGTYIMKVFSKGAIFSSRFIKQ